MWTMCGLPTALCRQRWWICCCGRPYEGVLRKLDLSGYAEISPELILGLARGFETMTALYLPDGEVFSAEPEFYQLTRASAAHDKGV